MKPSHPRQASRDWTAVWLGAAAAVLLMLAAAFLAQAHAREMQALREQAAQTRARLIAQSIGQRLANATAAGIPLGQLVGVPEFLDRWHASHPEITHIAVHGLDGRQLWSGHGQALPATPEVSTGSAAVIAADTAQARVRLQVRNGSRQGPGQQLGQLAPALLLVSALAYLGARFACAQGAWLRNHGVRTIARWALRGDYRQLLVLPQRQPFDLRVQEIAQAMRDIHERAMRLRLLIGSLRRTEPQQLRRDYLDQVLQQTQGRELFADPEPAVMRLVAVQSQSLWMALLLGLGAVGPLAYALRAYPADGYWQAALPGACLGALALAAGAGWQLAARLRLATLSVLQLSLAALALAPLAMLLDSGPHPGWIAAWNGLFAGAARAACTRAQTHPDAHPGFMQAAPGIPGAALLAWWAGLLWLAPALGYYAHAALRMPWAVPALLLPVACALLLATCWDVAHSPWRVRMAAGPGADAGTPSSWRAPSWRCGTLGMAAGLVAGRLLLDLSTARGPLSAALLAQCALGLGLAVAWAWRGQDAAAAPRPWAWRWCASALAAAAMLAAAHLPALAGAAWFAPLLLQLVLGLLLGQGLVQAAQRSQPAASQQLLLGSAFGAALSVAAARLGWHDMAPVWALLPALLAAAPRKGPHVA